MFNLDGTPVSRKHQAAYNDALLNSLKEVRNTDRKRQKEIRSQLGFSRIGRNNV